MESPLTSQYWDNRYKTQEIQWDLGHVSPPIKHYCDTLVDKSINILIPGAGNAYEAEYLFNNGFNSVHVVDYSNIAINNLRGRVPEFPATHTHCIDFFKHEGQYDLIIEQTFFCALHPSLRTNYVNKMHDLLKPNGLLVGLLFNIPLNHDHPPFGGDESIYRKLFTTKFNIDKLATSTDSIRPRMGNELLFEFSKR